MSGAAPAPPPLFISFEGIDGSGKSTQARALAVHLRQQGRDVVLTREPGGSPGAEAIRTLVLTGEPGRWSAETEILLFTASRRDHLERTIRPALAAGRAVITDRFADSTRIYQGATRGDLRAMVDRLHDLMIGVEPDLTFVIDMDPRVALGRSLGRLSASKAGRAAAMAPGAAGTQGEAEVAGDAVDAAQAAANAHSLASAAGSIAAGDMPEDRFESFGPLFQQTLRAGFLQLAQDFAHRCVVIDGNRDPVAVAADIAARLAARTPR